LGNEIYLVSGNQAIQLKENYDSATMYYPHFLLIALDLEGNEQIRQLSTLAWERAYVQRGLVRTPTLMSDIEEIIGLSKGHVIGSTACLGSTLDKWIIDRQLNHNYSRDKNIEWFINWGTNTFGKDNFYLECQPAYSDNIEQWTVNNYILELSKKYKVPYIITTDAHYLRKDLLKVHGSFLNSDDNGQEREVDAFYATAYLMEEEEVRGYFRPFWTEEQIDVAIQNTDIIGERATKFIFNKKQIIPKIKFETDWHFKFESDLFPQTEYIQKTISSSYEDDRYLMYLLQKGIINLIPKEDYNSTFSRLETELYHFWKVSEKIEDRLHSYFITVAKIVDLMWTEGDSIVGAGRGSAVSSIISYLLEVTQINPLKMPVEMPFYRFIDEERPEISDIDIDTQSDKREQIFQAIKKYFNELSGDVINCCTYSTLSSKSAVLTACRGLNIDNDEAQIISNLVPVERGFNWELKDVYEGNAEKNRSPVREFINEIDKHSGLYDMALIIEGLIINRGIHASGVFLVNDEIYKYNAIMRSARMVRMSQWDLHDSEDFGLIKYDFLTTKALTKIRKTLEFVIADGLIQPEDTLKKTYYKYLDPMKIDYDSPNTWELIGNNQVVDLFQFDTNISVSTLCKIKPVSMIELAQTNSIMRLQQQPDALESPAETYVKYKKDISKAYVEMDKYHVPKSDQLILERVLKDYKFVADTQESIMSLVRIPELTDFTVAESHGLRKAVAKKSEKVFKEIEQKFYDKGMQNKVNVNTLKYIWDVQVKRQKGYSFSILHCIAYTFIALQEVILYQQYPPIYWNTACLTVNAGADDEEAETKKSTNYGKIAKAIGDMQQKNINITLPEINTAKFGFFPDVKNDRIVFGLKGICGIGDDIASAIIQNQPYLDFEDFIEKTKKYKAEDEENKFGDSAIIVLIKAGAFDELLNQDRVEIMKSFIRRISKPLSSLSFDNMPTLAELGLLTEDQMNYEYRIYKFRKYLYSKRFFVKQEGKSDNTSFYQLDRQFAEPFFINNFETNMIEDKDYYYDNQGFIVIKKGSLEREIKKIFKSIKETVLDSSATINAVNEKRFLDTWNEKVEGTISKWEMDSLSFYYHEHELAHVKADDYLIVDFSDLPEIPVIGGTYMYRGQSKPRFKLDRICGTVLDKDKNKHTVTLLTPNGVASIKFYKGQFSFYDKQISDIDENGKKTVLEKSWFTRGNKLLVTGYRREDQFVPKKYIDSAYRHTLQLITEIDDEGNLKLQSERSGGEASD